MPRAVSSKQSAGCPHTRLSYEPSDNAAEVGYSCPTAQQRAAAATPRGTLYSTESRQKDRGAEPPATFPAPLILPGDDLSWDPKHPPQSLRAWIRLKERNKVTPERKTIYLAASPTIDATVKHISKWIQPQQNLSSSAIEKPDIQDVLNYLQAFYYGLPVKLLSQSILRFTAVESTDYDLGLETNSPSGCIGVKTRQAPKEYATFTHQLNLNDLLDAAIAVLPDDAYALLMLVEHDIYEDDDDDFACGRAYGGSRIAVVSTARYNPVLDQQAGIEREHAWPASHCEEYLKSWIEGPGRKKKLQKTVARLDSPGTTPIRAAVAAHAALPDLEASPSAAALRGLWLGRVCRTAGHELGHCFGMDHCVYYACSMQGTASVIEDSRQPPYLCPVDLAKMLQATDSGAKGRYQAILTFCDQHKDTHLFEAFAAWIRARILEMESASDGEPEVIIID